MVSRLIYAPALAASIAYAGTSNSQPELPKVAQANDTEFKDTARWFAYLDFGVGFSVGLYNSLISYAYDDDCFS